MKTIEELKITRNNKLCTVKYTFNVANTHKLNRLSKAMMHTLVDHIISRKRVSDSDLPEETDDEPNWERISMSGDLSENELHKYADFLNWNLISEFQELSTELMTKFQDRLNWGLISEYQQLSEEQIRLFQDNVDWDCIVLYQTLSDEFTKEFEDRF
jgi:hypothetical protein